MLNVELAIFATCTRENAGALGFPGRSSVALFSHCPKNGTPLFQAYDFDSFNSLECHKTSGHYHWFDVKLQKNGTLMERGYLALILIKKLDIIGNCTSSSKMLVEY